MIDEKKLIEDVIPILNEHGDMYLTGRIIGLIDSQPRTDWIPCEERLPSEENEEYLVCEKNGCLMLLVWTKKGWNTYKDYYGKYHTKCEINDVIAWMPKPQPYKKEGADDECN